MNSSAIALIVSKLHLKSKVQISSRLYINCMYWLYFKSYIMELQNNSNKNKTTDDNKIICNISI